MSKKRISVAYLLNKLTQNVYDINSWACIGRNKTASVCITNPAVSRSHACLQYHAETNSWTVTDTGSTLGTKVNNIKLVQDEAMQIKNGDEIQLAELEEVTFKFCVGNPPFVLEKVVSAEKNMDDENVDENIGDRHNLQSSQDMAVFQMDENKNKIKQIEDSYRLQSERLSNKFESQTFQMNSQSDEFRTLEKTYKSAIDKLKAEMEMEIQSLRFTNEELLTRLDIEERHLLEQTEKSKQAKESEELAQANLKLAQANLLKLKKENEEKEEERKKLYDWLKHKIQEIKSKLKHKIQEIKRKNLEKTEELNSLKKDLKLAVSKKEERENATLTTHLDAISDHIESEMLCSICSELMIDVAVLNCGHTFCERCIAEWLNKKKEAAPVCPMCRFPVISLGKCTVLNSLLESVSESLPSLKRKRLELIEERSGRLKGRVQSAGTSRHPEAIPDVFAFPSNIVPASGSGQRTVTGPVDHIDLMLDDSVAAQEIPAGLGELQNNQQIDLTAVTTETTEPQQQHHTTTVAQAQQHSVQRNRTRRGRLRRSSSRR